MKVLHVAAELFPWVKTGGLADVVAALPPALTGLGADVRVLVPGYPALLSALQAPVVVAEGGACFGALRVRLLRGQLLDPAAAQPLTAYAIDAPYFYARDGGPYQDLQWRAWPDNAQRFALLGWLAAQLGAGAADPAWQPAIVHAHDWHAALACAWLHEAGGSRVASVFTVHNLAYQGITSLADAPLLNIGSRWLTPAGLEFHGQLNMLKAGLGFADEVTTVSPGYAREITTTEFGCGLEGVIAGRGAQVSGILNGIDTRQWDPAADAALVERYSAADLAGKAACRAALIAECGLGPSAGAGSNAEPIDLLLAVVSRLTAQKGLDLLLAAMTPLLAQHRIGLVLQGSGDPALESAFRRLEQQHPGRVRVFTDFDEGRAHRIVAGADAIVVPSRFEPCGLTQLYGLRYGTVPIVRRVGGLADTVQDGQTGFVFDAATPAALQAAVERAATMRSADAAAWRALQRAGMAQELSWTTPARQYLALYERACARRRTA